MKTKTVEITNWPVLPVKETNRQRIIRALREATMPQCYGALKNGDARCVLGLLGDEVPGYPTMMGAKAFGDDGAGIMDLNNKERLTFREIADRLESDSYWDEHGDEEFKDGS